MECIDYGPIWTKSDRGTNPPHADKLGRRQRAPCTYGTCPKRSRLGQLMDNILNRRQKCPRRRSLDEYFQPFFFNSYKKNLTTVN